MNSSATFSRLSNAVDFLVDDEIGIIKYVAEWPREAGGPEFFYFYAEACDTAAFTKQKNFASSGGASADRSVAMAKAIGEAVERYCSAIYDREEFPLFSFDCATFPCVSPSDFALYSPTQYAQSGFPYVPFENNTPVRWTPAKDLITGQISYVPAAMVWLPYSFDGENRESAIVQRISTGLACHCSYEEAAISAICEVIERDAFTITWQARLAMPCILNESLSEESKDLISRFERCGDSVTLLNITTDVGVPTILGILRGRAPEAPALVFAASSDLNPEQAIRKSLEELAHTRRLAQRLKLSKPALIPTCDFSNIKNRDSHVHLYADHRSTYLSDFIFSSTEYQSLEDIENLSTVDSARNLQTLLQKVHKIHYRVLLSDLTTPDVEALGLKVLRAVIPGFHPLFMGHKVRALGGRRLWEVPQKLGYGGISPDTGANPAPHPYP